MAGIGHSLLELAVVGRADARWGEVPVSLIAARENHALCKEQLLKWPKGKLGKYKHPRDIKSR